MLLLTHQTRRVRSVEVGTVVEVDIVGVGILAEDTLVVQDSPVGAVVEGAVVEDTPVDSFAVVGSLAVVGNLAVDSLAVADSLVVAGMLAEQGLSVEGGLVGAVVVVSRPAPGMFPVAVVAPLDARPLTLMEQTPCLQRWLLPCSDPPVQRRALQRARILAQDSYQRASPSMH